MLIPGTGFNSNRDKLFFFWSQDLLPRNDPGTLQQQHDADGARARRRLLADRRQPAASGIWIKDPLLAAQGLACNANTGGPGCFANNIIPADRINPHRPADAEPLPAAERDRSVRHPAVQLPARGRAREAAARPGARVDWNVDREHDVLHPRAVRPRSELARRQRVPRRRPGNGGNADWPQMQNSYDIDTVSMVNTLLHTFNSTMVVKSTVGLELGRAAGQPRLAGGARCRNDRRVVLGGLSQFFPRPTRQTSIPKITLGGTNALPNTRASASSSNATRSTRATRPGTSPRTSRSSAARTT